MAALCCVFTKDTGIVSQHENGSGSSHFQSLTPEDKRVPILVPEFLPHPFAHQEPLGVHRSQLFLLSHSARHHTHTN